MAKLKPDSHIEEKNFEDKDNCILNSKQKTDEISQTLSIF